MARALTYADAVRMLGGRSKVVDAIDKISGGLLLATTGGLSELANWFDAKDQFIQLCHDLLTRVNTGHPGLSRYDRTERLQAAHTVLVVLAFFDAMNEADLPFPSKDFRLSAMDQLSLASGGAPLPPAGATFMAAVQSAGTLLPEPHIPDDVLVDMLSRHYAGLAAAIGRLAPDLALWDWLTERDRRHFNHALEELPDRACRRYRELFRQLATEFPELAFWAGLREHTATRTEVRKLGAALADMERVLTQISTGRAPDDRHLQLARANALVLDQPIVESGEVLGGEVRIPALREGHVEPLFRVTSAAHEGRLSDESWWEALPVRDDLWQFLTGFLTSRQATQAPLVVLGQPGSGKSLLTKVLAARLPAHDFLAVRVLLREVPASVSIQDQIEYAIRNATGERLDWPELVRLGGDALPVVLLDGFDELLQTTGVSQSDYLGKVADFQRREADQGRPVAVIVTSRTSVADRARAPEDTVAMRIEPFDDHRVHRWVATWNEINHDHFVSHDLVPLDAEIVLAHPDLAEQPLLLMMMALYDADGNALRKDENHLLEDQLYDRLLRSFARREVVRHRPELSDRDIDINVENELRRLSVLAFGMFNRRSLWITDSDLERDLPALLGETPHIPVPADMRAPLRASEVVLGRFFFIHRATTLRDNSRLEAYEFLHATFGEFLVARLTWQVLGDMAARETASTLMLSAAPLNDDLLHALLSFAPLSLRTRTVYFLSQMAGRHSHAQSDTLIGLITKLFRVAHHPRSGRGYAAYRPRHLSVPARHAAYSANLLLLSVCIARKVPASMLFGYEGDTIDAWKDEALLWRSQLGADGWDSLVGTVAVQRLWEANGSRDLLLSFSDGTTRLPPVDLFWTYNSTPHDLDQHSPYLNLGQHPSTLLRKAHFLGRVTEDLTSHTLEPLIAALGPAVNTVIGSGSGSARTAVNALLDAWLLPDGRAPQDRETAYALCAEIATKQVSPWDDTTRARYTVLLLGQLANDMEIGPATAARILRSLAEPDLVGLPGVARGLVRCVLAFYGADAECDADLIRVLDLTESFSGLDRRTTVEESREQLTRLARFVAMTPPDAAATDPLD
ncbi:hypothetical protein [Luedemannella helvata]|uniref:NACHT N-terminal Helical domain-containing protein n=1 Tax=Luedemannella helvata TaxID=349315 RepID=A0ABP4VUY1_9ACTN